MLPKVKYLDAYRIDSEGGVSPMRHSIPVSSLKKQAIYAQESGNAEHNVLGQFGFFSGIDVEVLMTERSLREYRGSLRLRTKDGTRVYRGKLEHYDFRGNLALSLDVAVKPLGTRKEIERRGREKNTDPHKKVDAAINRFYAGMLGM